jgi:multidrug efflux pump subunit AcrA (membrane-fusion protein)
MPVKRIVLMSVFGVIVIAGVYAVLSAALRPVEVEVGHVRPGEAIETVYATGLVEARERRSLRAERPAVIEVVYNSPRTERRFIEGDEVRAGESILRLRDSTLEADLSAARTELERLTNQLARDSAFRQAFELRVAEAEKTADNERTREQRLRQQLGSGAISRDAYDQALTRADTAAQRAAQVKQDYERVLADLRAERDAAASRIESLEGRRRDNIITAPIDGVILRLPFKEGELAAAGVELALVGDVRELILEAEVNEDDIPRVSEGAEVMIRLAGYDDVNVWGTVYEILPDAVRITRGYTVRVAFRESRFIRREGSDLRGRTRLEGDIFPRSGATAELGIIVARRDEALIFPRSALASDNRVYRIRGSRVEEVQVTLGLTNFRVCEALSGLEDGDRVAVTNLRQLSDGARIAIKD